MAVYWNLYSFEKFENEEFACSNALDMEILDDQDNYAVFLDSAMKSVMRLGLH